MDDSVASLMAEKLSWTMETWSSVELRILVEGKNVADGTRGHGMETYIETSLGQRMYERSWPGVKIGETSRKVDYADGKRFAESSWTAGEQENVIYKDSFSNEATTALGWRPRPLAYLYLQHQPLAKMLPKAEHRGQERRLGRDCEVLILKGVKWTYSPVDIVYHLDRETGYPLEVRCFNVGADPLRDKPLWYWEAKSFERLEGGRYWPMRSIDATFALDGNGGSQLLKTGAYQVESIQFNKDYPASFFQPKEEPGTRVLDGVHKKKWIAPGVKKAVEPAANTSVALPQPVLAIPPAHWTATASSVGLILGLALIAVGAFAWWSRQR